jgi:arylsulfatase A-like enzyme
MHEPYLAVVQMSNTHFPYWVDDHDLPFSARARQGMSDMERTRLRYWDSIRRQDRAVARFVTGLRARPEASRTVVVFISDHGEQIGERGQVGHTWSMYDQEVHVPMWIDAPPGTLTAQEEKTLRSLENVSLTQLDIAPTMLDLLGVWDEAAIAGYRANMPGSSLLRGGSPPDRPVVMTNCSAIFSCATKNWGAMRGGKKLFATQDEPGPWHCFDVANDANERRDLGPAACSELRALAEGQGRGTPY